MHFEHNWPGAAADATANLKNRREDEPAWHNAAAFQTECPSGDLQLAGSAPLDHTNEVQRNMEPRWD